MDFTYEIPRFSPNFPEKLANVPDMFTGYVIPSCSVQYYEQESFSSEKVQITNFPGVFQMSVTFPDFSPISIIEIKFSDNFLTSLIVW